MIFKRAMKDTLAGQITALFVLVVGALISLVYLYVTESPQVAVGEIPYVTGGLIGAIGSLFLLFVWNLVWAPYRIERDAHLETKNKLAQLEAQMPKQASPRKLSAENRLALTSFLKNSPTKPPHLQVIYHTSDEATDFAVNIGDAIREANIECVVHDGFWFDRNPYDRGVLVHSTHEQEMKDLASGLCAIIESFGFLCATRETDYKEPMIFLYVARQSEP